MIQTRYVQMDDFQRKIHAINSKDCSKRRQMSAKIFKFENIKFCCNLPCAAAESSGVNPKLVIALISASCSMRNLTTFISPTFFKKQVKKLLICVDFNAKSIQKYPSQPPHATPTFQRCLCDLYQSRIEEIASCWLCYLQIGMNAIFKKRKRNFDGLTSAIFGWPFSR